jgi:hypothetical protein
VPRRRFQKGRLVTRGSRNPQRCGIYREDVLLKDGTPRTADVVRPLFISHHRLIFTLGYGNYTDTALLWFYCRGFFLWRR